MAVKYVKEFEFPSNGRKCGGKVTKKHALGGPVAAHVPVPVVAPRAVVAPVALKKGGKASKKPSARAKIAKLAAANARMMEAEEVPQGSPVQMPRPVPAPPPCAGRGFNSAPMFGAKKGGQAKKK